MIRRIDLFMPPFSQYGLLHHFTKQMYEALMRHGVEARLLEADYHNPKKFLDAIFASPPECTLSFNGLLPDSEGRFFCDLVKIPHIACLVDSPNRFVELIKSKRTIVTCVDRFSCNFFQGLGLPHVFFMPHAVSPSLCPPKEEGKKEYDAVLLASFIDYEAIRNGWADKYPTAVHWALHEAAEEALRNGERSYVEIFVEAFDRQLQTLGGVDPRTINLVAILQDLEDYINGKDRVELVRSLQGIRLDIFSQAKEEEWKKYLGKEFGNVQLHGAIPFDEALEVMKLSRVILNSCPSLRLGGHERVFAGLACGAALLSSDSAYLRETFTAGKDILFYQHGDRNGIANMVESLIKDEGKRFELANRGREVVMEYHTWDERAKMLLQRVPSMLDAINGVNSNL